MLLIKGELSLPLCLLAQEPKTTADTTQFKPRVYDARIVRPLPAAPDSLQDNPYKDLKKDSFKTTKTK